MRTITWVMMSVAIAVITGFGAIIVYRNYSAVLYDFAATPLSDTAKHLDQVGIPQLEEVSFKNKNGLTVGGWYAPSHNQAAVIITHGTNSDRSSMLDETRILANAGYGVLAIDWPGCGASAGIVKWSRDERSALTGAIDWLEHRHDMDRHKIGGLGFSMGAFMMAQVASMDTRLHAVILEAAPPGFEEYTRWAHRRWGVLSEYGATLGLKASGMPVSEIRPVDVVRLISPRKLLIIGGSADPVIPEFMTHALYSASGEGASLWIIDGAAHGGYLRSAPAEYPIRIVRFFEEGLLGYKASDLSGSVNN